MRQLAVGRTIHVLTFVGLIAGISLAAAVAAHAAEIPFEQRDPILIDALGTAELSLADIDGDGVLDLVHGANQPADPPTWLAGDGAGGFGPPTVVGTSNGDRTLPADLDGDGDVDLLFVANSLRWLENTDGAGTFSLAQTIHASGSYAGVIAVDLDGDGDLDIVAAERNNDEYVWYENLGGANFGDTTTNEQSVGLITLFNNENVEAVDLDGDGDLDLVGASGSGSVEWFKQQPGGAFMPASSAIGTLNSPNRVAVGDIDGDGDVDVVSADRGGSVATISIRWFDNTSGDGSTWTENVVAVFRSENGIELVDLDRDGDLDVLSGRDDLVWFENTAGDGTAWTTRTLSTIFDEPNLKVAAVATADLDGDGDPELLAATNAQVSDFDQRLLVFDNRLIHRNAVFQSPATLVGNSTRVRSLVPLDVDGDGDLDIATVGETSPGSGGQVEWWENTDGQGTFAASAVMGPTVDHGMSIRAGDIDRDGRTDLITASRLDDRIVWFQNDPIQFFWWDIATNIDAAAYALPVDIDRDGDLDVISAGSGTGAGNNGTVTIHENDGTPTTTPWPTTIPLSTTAGGATYVLAEDFDRDGDLDVMWSEAVDNVVTWRRSNGDGTFAADETVTSIVDPWSMVAADLDGDGDLDVAIASSLTSTTTNEVAWVENTDGAGTWGPKQTLSTIAEGAYGIAAGDPDQDGDVDLVVACRDIDEVKFYENSGGSPPTFAESVILNVEDAVSGVTFADIDGDGDEDVATAAYLANRLRWLPNVGGQFGIVQHTQDGQPLFTGRDFHEGERKALFGALVRLNGRPGDSVGRLDTIDLYFQGTGVGAMSSAEANALFDSLHFYRDDGDDVWEPDEDVLLASFATLNLTGGSESYPLPASDPNTRIAAPVTIHVVIEMTDDASLQSPNQFRITHLASDGSDMRDAASDLLLTREPSADAITLENTATGTYVVDTTADAVDAIPGDGGICATASGDCSLRAAIMQANADAVDRRIVLGAGTYTLTIAGAGEEFAATGDLDVIGDPGFGSWTLTLVGAGANLTTIDAGGLDRAFDLRDSVQVIFEDLTIRDGAVTGDGGAIRALPPGGPMGSLTLTIRRCRLTGNSASGGGALYFGNGGGIGNSSINIHESLLDANVVTGGGFGAAVSVNLDIDVRNSTFSGNTGSAAIYSSLGGPGYRILGSTITANDAGVEASGGMTLMNSIVAGNATDLIGDFSTEGYNLIGNGDGATINAAPGPGDQIGTTASPIDPLLDPLGDYGGTTLSHALKPTSPVLDAGSCGFPFSSSADQRGAARPNDIPSVPNVDDGCDIGAVESDAGPSRSPISIPIRWCGVRGAPSIEDPSLVGAASTNGVMRRRHERASAGIYRPQGNVRFRSAANEIVEDYPLLEDPDCVEGPPSVWTCEHGSRGDVYIDPRAAIFDELAELMHACRAAWQAQDPTITGITAVHINRFVGDDGTPLAILGIGGRAAEGDASEQTSAGRVMVVDNVYRQGANPPDLVDRLLGHEMGHALSLRHGDGTDNDGNGTIDDNDEASQGKPRFDGPNLMQYRSGTQLSQAQIDQMRLHMLLTVPDVTAQPISDSASTATEFDEKNARVLEFGFDGVNDIANARVLEFKNALVLEFENAKVLEFENARVLEFKNARVLEFKNAKVLEFGMGYDGEQPTDTATIQGTTGALPWPAALRPDTTYHFYLDLDRDDATGGYPGDSPNPADPGNNFPGYDNFVAQPNVAEEAGVDFILQVRLESDCPADDCSSNAVMRGFDYSDGTGQYEEVVLPSSTPSITTPEVGLYQDVGGAAVDYETVPQAMTIRAELPNSLLFAAGWGFSTPPGGGAPVPDPIRMEVVSSIDCQGSLLNDDPASGTRDCQCTDCAVCPDYPGCTAGSGTPQTLADSTIIADCTMNELTFEPPVLPKCTVSPALAAEGATVTVHLIDLPTDVVGTVEVAIDDAQVGSEPTSSIDASGAVDVSVALPFGTTGNVVLSGGIVDRAPRADCEVTVTPAPACPDNDNDGICDADDPDDDNDGVADASDSAPFNALACADSDGDGCDDCVSGTVDANADGPDFDLDGLCDDGDPDDDNDGVPDGADLAPRNANACGDSDGDRCDDCVIAASPAPANDGPDSDADGLCDFGDDDDDNDGAIDQADCSPFDAGVSGSGPVGGLTVEADRVRVSWDSVQAAYGSATVADVIRGTGWPVGAGAESCLANGITDSFVDDTDVPGGGTVFWYLVSASNACGGGDLGQDSGDVPRVSSACP